MLQPSPEWQYQFDVAEAQAIKIEQRRMKIKKRLYKAATIGLLLSIPTSAYVSDVQRNQALEANSDIGISVLGGPLDKANDDKALVFLDGFGSIDADTLTESLGRPVQQDIDGQLWSVGYNDAPLSYNNTADKIIKKADISGVDTISVIGYSAGGSFSAEVVDAISQKSSLRIENVGFISTPDGAGGLRVASQNQIGLVEALKVIPGAEYSSYVRFLGEMAFRAHTYDSDPNIFNRPGEFFTTWNQVQSEINDQELPGTWLMFDQVLAIENANIKDRIADMGKIPNTRVHPTIFYLGTSAPGYDDIVNNEKSEQNIASYAKAAKLPFFSANVPGAVHARPDLDTDEYVKTLAAMKPEIQMSINHQISIAYENLLNDRYKHVPKTEPYTSVGPTLPVADSTSAPVDR